MSHVEKITGELRTLTTGVERAQGLAAATHKQAQEVALRAAAAGFAAVAAGMTRVQAAVSEIQGVLNGLATSLGEATKTTAAVPHRATPQETITGLTPVRNAVDGVRDTTTRAIGQLGETRQLATMVLQGGQPGPMLSALESIRQVLTLVVQRTSVTRQSVEAAIAEARQLGSSGN
ncbi:DUF6244 family protein [Micromonospora sp. NPDC020750]|uniref:DUF6244 family protein n=1 Tax=unclassified Micromonospora TaxID=2617518 RepID=UPI0037A063C8